MGSALLMGWFRTMPDLLVSVVEPNDLHIVDPNIRHFQSITDIDPTHTFDLLVLAVKPQTMKLTCESIKRHLGQLPPVLSIAAGKNLKFYASQFGETAPVMRSMPNTPAAIGHGITVICANQYVPPYSRNLAHQLLSAVGKVEWLDDETLMDAVTAVSGSGPAYVFLLIEELANAGMECGLPETVALALARQTVIGSAYLAETEAQIDAATLRRNVTSPGGTTEAALKVLMGQNGLHTILREAVAAATQRGKELAS